MRKTVVNPEALNDLARLVIRGFDETDGTGGTGSSDSGTGEGGTGDGSGSEGDSGGGDDSTDDEGGVEDEVPTDVAKLQAALKAERELRRKAEKGLKLSDREKRKLEKAQQDIKDAEQGEVAAAKTAASKSAEQVKSLGAKLKTQALESAIKEAATKAKFRDPDDVITQLQRNNFADIEIDQDEDDPSDIEIDAKSVEKAVKAVATAKPHWLIAAGQGSSSGSSFNGAGPGNGQGNKQAEYASRYPALRNRIGSQGSGSSN